MTKYICSFNGWFISLPAYPPGQPRGYGFQYVPGGGDMDATFCPGVGTHVRLKMIFIGNLWFIINKNVKNCARG